MLLTDPFILALQLVIIIISQPKPCIADGRCFVAKHQLKKLLCSCTVWLTAMIIPPSTLNVMSNEDDCYFQCQEP